MHQLHLVRCFALALPERLIRLAYASLYLSLLLDSAQAVAHVGSSEASRLTPDEPSQENGEHYHLHLPVECDQCSFSAAPQFLRSRAFVLAQCGSVCCEYR